MVLSIGENLNAIRSFWNCLINVGVNDKVRQDESKYVRFSNVIAALTAFAVFVYIPYSIYLGNYMLGGLQTLDLLFVVFPIWLNHIGHNRFARHFYLVVVNAFVLINSCFIGYESRVHDFFYIVFVVPFLLFRVNDFKNIVLGTLSAILFFNVYQHIYPLFIAYNLPVSDQLAICDINVWMKFLLFGIAIYILAYYNFISEKALSVTNKKLEEQAIELQRSNQDLEQFAYIISHDLKSPVRNISSFMKLLLTRFGSSVNPDVNELVEMSKLSADRLAKQIDDLLSYCRVGRNLPPTAEVDVNQMIQIINMELGEKLKENNARIVVEQKMPVLKNVHGSMVHHVFQNLIANGVKFNTNSNPEVKVDYKVENNMLTFQISDNGIGIEKGFENKLFQMFKRLHTDQQFEGTGIGLAVCKKIINFYSGNIWFESQTGKGTTFFFTLPLNFLCSDETQVSRQVKTNSDSTVISINSRRLQKMSRASVL